MLTELPLWKDCAAKYDEGKPLSTLEFFILTNEPRNPTSCECFRQDLLAIINNPEAER